ncbi:MAG TPA: hypothetical protein PLZ32_22110 [Saprospiraceae bacterium]|nr:hypothetical protein [Saprospiraceae bacterium]
MRKFIFILTVLFCFVASQSLQAQDYKSSIGAKLGYGLIGSYKTFLSESSAVELFGGIRWGGFALGGFYQIHKDIESVDNLRWFLGGGATFTTWSYGFGSLGSYSEVGAHFDLGLEYTFPDLPLNVSVDWAPGFVLVDTYDFTDSYNRLRFGYGALTARYILNR